MNSLITFLKYELLIWFRMKENLFWAIAWPLCWLLLMYNLFPSMPGMNKAETLNYYYPSAISLILLSSALTSLVIAIATGKEKNILKRFVLLPISKSYFFTVKMMASFILTLFSVIVITVFSFSMGASLSFSATHFLVWLLLGFYAFSGVAFLIAGITSPHYS